MTKANNKSDAIRSKIAKSEAQLNGDRKLPAVRTPDASPPKNFSSLIGDYPGLAIAGGLGLGLLAGALLPRSAGRKLFRGGAFVASTAGELGLAFGKQALSKVGDASREGREKLSQTLSEAGRLAGDAGRNAADVGQKAADVGRKAASAGRKTGATALHAAGEATERTRELGIELVKRAGEVAGRLRH